MEVTAVVMTQPTRLIAGSTTAPSFLIDVHLLSCFFLLLFARVGFPDGCYCWAERGTKRNCLGHACGEATRYLDALSREQRLCICKVSDGTNIRLSDLSKKRNCVHLEALRSKIAAWI